MLFVMKLMYNFNVYLLQEEIEGKPSSEESSDEYSSDDDQKWAKELKSEYRSAKRRRIAAEREERTKSRKESDDDNESDDSINSEPTIKPPKFYEIKEGEEFVGPNGNRLNSVQDSGYNFISSHCVTSLNS